MQKVGAEKLCIRQKNFICALHNIFVLEHILVVRFFFFFLC